MVGISFVSREAWSRFLFPWLAPLESLGMQYLFFAPISPGVSEPKRLLERLVQALQKRDSMPHIRITRVLLVPIATFEHHY
jgi:hypothetical protein